MSELLGLSAATLLWPGLAGGALLAWLYQWISRKSIARFQARKGPPFRQPFFDFVKLLSKQTVVPQGISSLLFYGLPAVSVIALCFALALIPVPGNPAPAIGGDLVILVYLLELPALTDILAGYATRSVYGQVSAAREAILSLAYNLPFLAGLIALALQANSFSLQKIATLPWSPVHVLAGLAFLLALPGRLKSNPFSIPNAEQEIVASAHLEFNGVPLALFELAHGLEVVALASLFAAFVVRSILPPVWGIVAFVAVSGLLVALTSLLAAATARIKVHQAFRFYWTWGAAAGALSLIAAAIW